MGVAVPRASSAQDADTAETGGSSSTQVGYDPERGAYIGTLDHRWELNPYGMVQLQNATSWGHGIDAQTSFLLRAAKLILHGHALSPTITYHLQLNAGDGKVAAEDVYLRWDPLPYFGLLLGQYEVPFNRQHMTLEAYQQFVERSAVDARFTLQRDLGAAVYIHDSDQIVEWVTGIWNGSRQNAPNDNTTYLATSRVAWNPWGPIGFREADLADSHTPKLSLAVAAAYNPRRSIAAGSATTVTRDIMQAVFESTFRYRGISFTTETHLRRQRTAGSAAARDFGQLVQLGVFVIPNHAELVARVAVVAADRTTSDVARELGSGVNWYLHGHRFKVQADYANLRLVSGVTAQRARLQLELFL